MAGSLHAAASGSAAFPPVDPDYLTGSGRGMSTRPGRERHTPVQGLLACVRSFTVSEERAWINELDRIAEGDDELAGTPGESRKPTKRSK